jgi:hypothetical protein
LEEDESLFVKGVIQSKKRNRAVFISYSEDQLADTFKSMALAMFPNEFVYDTFLWSSMVLRAYSTGQI